MRKGSITGEIPQLTLLHLLLYYLTSNKRVAYTLPFVLITQ